MHYKNEKNEFENKNSTTIFISLNLPEQEKHFCILQGS